MSFGLGAGRDVSVIGAGFSGLVAAYALTRSGYRVTVLEASTRAGGLLQTEKLEQGLVETAANALLNSPSVEELFSTIGVPLQGTMRSAKKRFIFRGGKSYRWPLGWGATFRVVKFGLRYLINKQSLAPRSRESARTWATRTLGEEASHYFIEAALQGIYAGDPTRLSATLVFGRFFRQRRDDVLQAAGFGLSTSLNSTPNRAPKKKTAHARGSVAPPEGMGQLIAGLESYLRRSGVQFEYGVSRTLETVPDHPVVVAVAGHRVAEVIGQILPAKALIAQRIEFSPVTSTTAFFDGTDSRTKGFGVLFPPVESRRALGVLKNNFIFPKRANVGFSETWIVGGALASRFVTDENEKEVLSRIQKERELSFGRSDQVFASRTTRWPKGIPHYTLELESEVHLLQGLEKNVVLIGNYLGDIGLAKILDRALRLPLQLSQSGQWNQASSERT